MVKAIRVRRCPVRPKRKEVERFDRVKIYDEESLLDFMVRIGEYSKYKLPKMERSTYSDCITIRFLELESDEDYSARLVKYEKAMEE